jgi:hypothetical protein
MVETKNISRDFGLEIKKNMGVASHKTINLCNAIPRLVINFSK